MLLGYAATLCSVSLCSALLAPSFIFGYASSMFQSQASEASTLRAGLLRKHTKTIKLEETVRRPQREDDKT